MKFFMATGARLRVVRWLFGWLHLPVGCLFGLVRVVWVFQSPFSAEPARDSELDERSYLGRKSPASWRE